MTSRRSIGSTDQRSPVASFNAHGPGRWAHRQGEADFKDDEHTSAIDYAAGLEFPALAYPEGPRSRSAAITGMLHRATPQADDGE